MEKIMKRTLWNITFASIITLVAYIALVRLTKIKITSTYNIIV